MIVDDFDWEEEVDDIDVGNNGTADIFSAVSLPTLGSNLPEGVSEAIGDIPQAKTVQHIKPVQSIEAIQDIEPQRGSGRSGESTETEPASVNSELATIKHIATDEPEGLITDEKYLGNFRTHMPQMPENIVEFEMLEDEPSGKFESGTVLITKRFKRFNYPQLRVSEKILEHKYLVTSLKALTTTKPADSVDELWYDVLIPFEDGDIIRLGVMSGRSLNKFLSSTVFADIDKEVYLSESEPVRGNLMFALCTSYTED